MSIDAPTFPRFPTPRDLGPKVPKSTTFCGCSAKHGVRPVDAQSRFRDTNPPRRVTASLQKKRTGSHDHPATTQTQKRHLSLICAPLRAHGSFFPEPRHVESFARTLSCALTAPDRSRLRPAFAFASSSLLSPLSRPAVLVRPLLAELAAARKNLTSFHRTFNPSGPAAAVALAWSAGPC